MSLFYNGNLLNQNDYDSDTSSFTIYSKEANDSVSINYIPKKVNEELNPNDYEIFVLENNSLIAENDIFLVHERRLNKGVGWIFPISVLESNENDYAEKVFFNQYRFLAYQKILSTSFKLEKSITVKKESYLLSDLFSGDLILFLVSLNELENEKNEFNIIKYLPSLSIHGYFLKNKIDLKYNCPKNYISDRFRGKKKIIIEEAKNPLYGSQFTKRLFTNYLKSLDHHLIRFHLLYQIVENNITDIFDDEFQQLLENYKEKLITKNNFIEGINKVRNERENIRKIFTDLNPNDGTFEKSILIDLKRDCKSFLLDFGVEEKNEIGDLLYDVRNILVHNYRSIEDHNIELLDEITFEFEVLISYLLSNSP